MGITGLIPFLEKASRPVHISQFSGCTAAIDAYCWLHKGAFGCADKLARGDDCDTFVHYCMKYVNTLLAHNIKPILVFDGRHLPAKGETEKKRRESREVNRRRAAELMRQDKPDQARTYLRRCIDVTHAMALALMKACRARNVDCITAPYEADAQLAYLNINNIAQIVITEDSDLLLFGCTRVLFKMDINGGGLLIEQEKLHIAMGVKSTTFSMDKFRYMCILSGCDYLPSLPGIGLTKACKFVNRTADPDIHRSLSRLGAHLNMNLVVPVEYRDNFIVADAMFRYQPVFDPISRKIVPLTPLPPGAPPLALPDKDNLSSSKALQLALGNLDPFTLNVVDNWDPDKPMENSVKTNSWNTVNTAPHKSIWSADFKPKNITFEKPELPPIQHVSTAGKEKRCKVDIQIPEAKRPPPLTSEEMLEALCERLEHTTPPPLKKPCLEIRNKHTPVAIKEEMPKTTTECSESKHRTNPFAKKATNVPSLSLSETPYSALAKFSRLKKTEIDDSYIVQSRYFGSNSQEMKTSNTVSNTSKSDSTLKEIQNIAASPEKKCSTSLQLEQFIKNSPQKNNARMNNNRSPVKAKTLFGALENEGVTNNNEKNENLTNINSKSSFKWVKSLEERFGFTNNVLKSSEAVSSEFRNPNKAESACKIEAKDGQTGSAQKSRNPFKICQSLGSQGSSCEEDAYEVNTQPSSSLVTKECKTPLLTPPRTPVQCRRPGLSKKTTPSTGRQQSLLNMFAFKPKNRLQT